MSPTSYQTAPPRNQLTVESINRDRHYNMRIHIVQHDLHNVNPNCALGIVRLLVFLLTDLLLSFHQPVQTISFD